MPKSILTRKIGSGLRNDRTWISSRSPYESPGITLLNNTGSSLICGDVVIIDSAVDRAVKFATKAGDANPLVVMTDASDGEYVRCYPLYGIGKLICDGPAISPGDKIITSATITMGKVLEAEAPDSILGIAVDEKVGAGEGEIGAILLCSPV